MRQSLWPELPENNAPIDNVTDDADVPNWIGPKMEFIYSRYLGLVWLENLSTTCQTVLSSGGIPKPGNMRSGDCAR